MAHWRRKVADWTELPQNLVAGMSFVSLTGNTQLVMENHRGLRCFSSQCMVVASAHGILTVMGDDLLVQILTRDELIIRGRIRQVILS